MLPPAGVSPLYDFPWPAPCRRGERREAGEGERRERKGRGDGGEEAPTSKQTVGENLADKAIKDRKKEKEREAKRKEMGEGEDQEKPGEEVEDLRLEAWEVVCAASRL